ncbi:SIR2 family protein [Peribacillus frigoritolerans]
MHTRIVEAIKNNKLIFFIGSGFSGSLGYPNWKTLIGNILTDLSTDYQELSPMKQLLESGLFSEIEVLDKLVPHRARVLEILDKQFSAIKKNQEQLKRHKKIGEISSKLITTNYDKALEVSNPTFKKIIYTSHYHIEKLYTYEHYIYKLHGCIEEPTSCILFRGEYEGLYSASSEHKLAVEELRKLIGENTIIFLGFSLSDPYVKYQFDYINSVYKELKGKHFLITTDKSINLNGIEPLTIDSWDEGLDNLLDDLLRVKQDQPQNLINTNIQESKSKIENKKEAEAIKIAILIASPMNKTFGYDLHKILKPFGNIDVKIDCFHLSIAQLNKLDGYQYILIFTKTVQSKFYIEDEFLVSKLTTLENLQSEILGEDFNCLFLFTDKDITLNSNYLYSSIIVKKYDENTFASFVFKTFRKGILSLSDNESQFVNKDMIKLIKLPQGKSKVFKEKTELPPEIDPKNLINFTGRASDLENICRKILELNGQLLTIKASGGIGKTTTIKKVSIELSERGYFYEGIHFIDCEYINDFNTFEYKVGQCFDLDSTINLREHMIQNAIKIDKLIIFDNFESLLYLNDKELINDLVSFLCDYATIITTSRQLIGFEFEDAYELRTLTTDECVDLFRKYHTNNIDEFDMRILRSDIIENLLNNNPLAIKIITSNIPKLKSMELLREELEEDFFNTTKLGIEDIFSDSVDKNIERSKSLYQSINYSYSKLMNNEKLVFELLSLFPDGIHMDTFVQLFKTDEYKKHNNNKVTDKEIKSLENKSLIQISTVNIKVQSIVGRFAKHKFSERSIPEKEGYYTKAFKYNAYLLYKLRGLKVAKTRLLFFDNNMENFLNSLSYLNQVTEDKMDLLEYTFEVADYMGFIYQGKNCIKPLEKLKDYFRNIEKSDLAFNVLILRLRYYEGEFKRSLNELKALLPFDDAIELVNSEDPVDELIFVNAVSIYKYGNELKILESTIENNIYYSGNYFDVLFSLGAYKLLEQYPFLKLEDDDTFFELEVLLNLGKLDSEYLNEKIEKLYNKEHIEIMQLNYIKAKMGLVTKETIKKLVAVNPYSFGLKNLMYAFLEEDFEKGYKFYKLAIKNLEHIKYYYVEAIYYFSSFLKKNNSAEYNDWSDTGKDLALEYQYRYLIHNFDCLLNDSYHPYLEDKYELQLEKKKLEYIIENVNKDKLNPVTNN